MHLKNKTVCNSLSVLRLSYEAYVSQGGRGWGGGGGCGGCERAAASLKWLWARHQTVRAGTCTGGTGLGGREGSWGEGEGSEESIGHRLRFASEKTKTSLVSETQGWIMWFSFLANLKVFFCLFFSFHVVQETPRGKFHNQMGEFSCTCKTENEMPAFLQYHRMFFSACFKYIIASEPTHRIKRRRDAAR